MVKIRISECPYCKEILAFYVTYKTKLCTRCGKRFDVSKSKQFGIFNSGSESIEMIKKIKATKKWKTNL